jgi:dipeptide transport system substrate-binding protein
MHFKLAIWPFVLAAPMAFAGATLTVCTDANPDGFDVVQYNSLVTTNASADQLMNRLVEYDARSRKLVPSLARSWTTSADGLSYTFQLRPGVAFHHTDYFTPSRTLNADDVLFSFKRMLDPTHPWYKSAANGYPHAQSLQLPKLVKSIVKVNDQTVRFELNYPDATFLAKLSMGFASIYSAEYAEKLLAADKTKDLNSKPVGTGPFVLKSYKKDILIRYVANTSYFGHVPKISQLIYEITPDPSVRVQKLKTGECQITLSPTPQDIHSAQNNPDFRQLHTPAFQTAFVAFNSQKKPFSDVRVRQAINLAFDRTAYVKAVFDGLALPATLPYPPSTWGYNQAIKPYPLNLAKAKQLLTQAGYPNGFSTTLWVRPTGSSSNPNPKIGAELLQSDLARIGIKATINVIEWSELIRRGKAGQHEMLFMGWSGDDGDPDDFLTPQFSCAAVKSGTNFARYCNPKLDKLISDGLRSSNYAQRSKLYNQAQSIIHEQAVWLPLVHPTTFALTRKNVTGYNLNPFGHQDFSTVELR